MFTTNQPLGQFFVGSIRQFLTMTATMAWITWLALVVGFAIADGVEARTSNEQVADLLDSHRPCEIGYGTLFGFVSSSCSYSAIVTGKDLFKKGSSAAATIGAFMFASTDLVIKSGIVIWLLLGWQFSLRLPRTRVHPGPVERHDQRDLDRVELQDGTERVRDRSVPIPLLALSLGRRRE